MANIAVGFERGRSTEFQQFLSIAKGSTADVRSQLYVAFDAGHIEERVVMELLARTEELEKVIGGLRVSVERKRDGKPPPTPAHHS
jgi:four helix bundle protein